MLFCKVLTILLWFCRSKGFGFVTFTGSSGIDEIQKNRPHEIDAKKIETKRATPKQVCQFPPKRYLRILKKLKLLRLSSFMVHSRFLVLS